MAERPKPWSAAEATATVASYLGMLQSELAGEGYVKNAARRTLLPLLNNRTESTVEFKYQNISAVPREPWAQLPDSGSLPQAGSARLRAVSGGYYPKPGSGRVTQHEPRGDHTVPGIGNP